MKTTETNSEVASFASILSVERDAAVQFVAHGAREVDGDSLRRSYVTSDRQLGSVGSQSAWPSPRPGEPAHLASVEAFSAALSVIRNKTLTMARKPEVNTTLASLFTFYVNVNEFLLLRVAETMQVRDRPFMLHV